MYELEPINNQNLQRIEDPRHTLTSEDIQVIGHTAENIVSRVTDTINNVSTIGRDIATICAQVEIETRRLEHALDCLMLKAQTDVQIYRESLPILDKNFTAMHSRMDKLMDKAMDMLCEDVSEASLKRQEMAMSLIEMTNNSLNNLIAKLMPNQ